MKCKYRQCCLRKESSNCCSRTVSYIPEKFAKVGQILRLKIADEWDDDWVVIRVGNLINELPSSKKQIREHRKQTGDSLPKDLQ